MGTLSKEIGRLEREHALNAGRTLRELWAKYPFLDHPACFLVKEMEKFLEKVRDRAARPFLADEAEALLKKIEDAK